MSVARGGDDSECTAPPSHTVFGHAHRPVHAHVSMAAEDTLQRLEGVAAGNPRRARGRRRGCVGLVCKRWGGGLRCCYMRLLTIA